MLIAHLPPVGRIRARGARDAAYFFLLPMDWLRPRVVSPRKRTINLFPHDVRPTEGRSRSNMRKDKMCVFIQRILLSFETRPDVGSLGVS